MIGLEFAGVLEDGSRVMGVAKAEALGNTILVNERDLMIIPESWTLEDGATIPVAFLTAYLALVVRGEIKKGQSILIHSGSGWSKGILGIIQSIKCCMYGYYAI